MNFSGGLFRAVGVLGVSGFAVMGVASGPSASFEVKPGVPSARSAVRFVDRSGGAPATSWFWTFGDGSTSALQNPTHVYAEAGAYPVTLRVTGGGVTTQTTYLVEVASATTLVLLAQTGHPFEVSLVAVNPNPAGTPPSEQAQAIPQNDVFGYFTFPLLVPTGPGAPLVPEVFVKMLDARPIPGQDFWVFWGGLTSLEYTLTVRDTVRGTIKTFNNPVTANPDCLSADTSGFASAPGATPTPTPPPGGTTRVVNVGQSGNAFVDSSSGGRRTDIRVGDTVQWNWMSGPHTTTSGGCQGSGDPYGGGYSCDGNGLWDSGSHSGPYQYTRRFTTAGSYSYYCEVHGAAMTATVVVSE